MGKAEAARFTLPKGILAPQRPRGSTSRLRYPLSVEKRIGLVTLIALSAVVSDASAKLSVLFRNGDNEIPLTSAEPLPSPPGANLVRGHGPWTPEAIRVALWDNMAPHIQIAPFGVRQKPKTFGPGQIVSDHVSHALLQYDALLEGAPKSSFTIDWSMPINPIAMSAPPATFVPLLTAPIQNTDPIDDAWFPSYATAYFALPMGTPSEASPHGTAVRADLDVTWSGSFMDKPTARVWIRSGAIDPRYVNATYAIGKPAPTRPNATIRVDFGGQKAGGGYVIASWVLAECVLAKPVTTGHTGNETYDQIDVTCTTMASSVDGSGGYTISVH